MYVVVVVCSFQPFFVLVHLGYITEKDLRLRLVIKHTHTYRERERERDIFSGGI
jgi:hypothetical protein